jgi:DNA repair photolyase
MRTQRKATAESSGIKILRWQRRAEVVTKASLPCLAAYHTLNLTAGCPNACVYCYAQHYAHNPGPGRLAYYVNAADRLRAEFPRMRERPTIVYLSTACDPFPPFEEILEHMYDVAEFLLEQGVSLVVSTKCVVPQRFVELFARHSALPAPFPRVTVQVGITTVDDSVRAVMEPRASTVAERLDSLRRLRAAGVAAEARLDPLVPGLTDTLDSFCELLPQLARTGVSDAAASYMFLRWGIRPPRDLGVRDWSFQEARNLYTHKVTQYCGAGTIYLPPTDYRRERYALLRDMAGAHGLRVRLCRCKNPELTTDCCNPLPKMHPQKASQEDLLV